MVADPNLISVGLGEIAVSKDPNDVLVAYGLGSCVGIGMYDPVSKVAGLLHAVLPAANGSDTQPGKYVNTGVASLLDALRAAGASPSRLQVRMAGGANMLNNNGFKNSLDIGERNVAAARTTLSAQRLPLRSQEVGGNIGRTVRLYVTDGRMTIRMMGGQEREF
jgi:chemotaxis protein CheD